MCGLLGVASHRLHESGDMSSAVKWSLRWCSPPTWIGLHTIFVRFSRLRMARDQTWVSFIRGTSRKVVCGHHHSATSTVKSAGCRIWLWMKTCAACWIGARIPWLLRQVSLVITRLRCVICCLYNLLGLRLTARISGSVWSLTWIVSRCSLINSTVICRGRPACFSP